MTSKQIQSLQTAIGVAADGFWGPKSIAACQKHLRKLMPLTNPWPKSDQKALTAFYGAAGDESRHTQISVETLGLLYEGAAVARITCHELVAASLLRVMRRVSLMHPEVLADYAGCYNNRTMRGGSLPSLHARAAAVDFMPGSNGNKSVWPVASSMPLAVMEEFSREGWLAAGAFWNRDAMHFQATQ